MKQCLVIGARGFLGQNLASHLRAGGVEVREAARDTPLDTLAGRSFDVVFFCAGNSRTYRVTKEPLACLEDDVAVPYRYLTALSYGKWVHVSSSVVYPVASARKEESAPIALDQVSLYGAHKLLAERYVQQYARHWVVLRPTGFFGPGLTKNLLFDLRSGGRHIYLTRQSAVDYLSVAAFSRIAETVAEQSDCEIINVGSGCVLTVDEILALKPGDYVFHDERWVDDRGIALDRLRRYWPARPDAAAFREELRGWLTS